MRSVPAGTAEEADVGETAPRFEEFHEATFRRLFTALCLVTGNRHEAEEVTEDAYVRVFERWDQIGMLEDPVVYLFGFRSTCSGAGTGELRSTSNVPCS